MSHAANPNSSTLTKLVITILVGVAIILSVIVYRASLARDAVLNSLVEDFNQKGAHMVSDTIRLDKVTAEDGSLILHQTVIDAPTNDNLIASIEGGFSQQIETLCDDANAQTVFKHHGVWVQRYAGHDGSPVTELTVTADHCR